MTKIVEMADNISQSEKKILIFLLGIIGFFAQF